MEVYEGGKSYYYHADGLGSVVALTKSTGTAANTYFGYNTFGGMPAPSETVSNPFRFTAREFDSETGLYYYRARYYDSLFGRFLSEDPLFHLNLYIYVANRPTRFADPSGADIAVVGDPAAYVQARQYLLQDPEIAPVIHDLERSGTVYTIKTNDSTGTSVDQYDDETKPITWNPHLALKCTGANARGSLSPAAALAHELVHAWLDHWWNLRGATPTNDDYSNLNDKYIIEHFEHHLIDLGEGIRYNHQGDVYLVPSPTAR